MESIVLLILGLLAMIVVILLAQIFVWAGDYLLPDDTGKAAIMKRKNCTVIVHRKSRFTDMSKKGYGKC